MELNFEFKVGGWSWMNFCLKFEVKFETEAQIEVWNLKMNFEVENQSWGLKTKLTVEV